jgi:hypothetical protein
MSSPGRLRGLSIGLASILAALQSGAVARAQSPVDWNHAVHGGLTNERILGLIDVPHLAGSKCDPEKPVTIELYDTPSTAKPSSGEIEFGVTRQQPGVSPCEVTYVSLRRAGARSAGPVLTEESGYEIPALIAYERAGRWFRIALPRGSAWMMMRDPQHFEQYPGFLLKDHLTFMAAGWDGRLWSTPGGSSAKVLSPKLKSFLKRLEGYQKEGMNLREKVDVDVLAVRRVGGEMWIQVRVTDGHCDGAESVTLDTGWVPAHGVTRKPSVWFYSRGC